MTKPFRLTLLAVLGLALVVAAACYPPAHAGSVIGPGAVQRHHGHRLAVDERFQQDDRRKDHGRQPTGLHHHLPR